jgi:hypothetical protein
MRWDVRIPTIKLLTIIITIGAGRSRRHTVAGTGHSAGAAIASLFYAHKRSTAILSLATVAAQFANSHCIMFGDLPVFIFQLQDYGNERSGSGSLVSFFLSLINDGDPIMKADVGYFAKQYQPIVH